MDWHAPIDRSKEFTDSVTTESCLALWRAVFTRVYDDATTSMPLYNSNTHLSCKEIQSARALFTHRLFQDDLESLCDLANIDFPVRREVHEAIAEAARGDGVIMSVTSSQKSLASA